MRIEFDYNNMTINVFEQNNKLFIEIWSDNPKQTRIKQLKQVNIIAVKTGISGISDPDLLYNLGDLVEQTREKLNV